MSKNLRSCGCCSDFNRFRKSVGIGISRVATHSSATKFWVGGQCMAGSAKQKASFSTAVVHRLKVERLGGVVAGTL